MIIKRIIKWLLAGIWCTISRLDTPTQWSKTISSSNFWLNTIRSKGLRHSTPNTPSFSLHDTDVQKDLANIITFKNELFNARRQIKAQPVQGKKLKRD